MEYDQNNMYKFFSYFSVNFVSLYVRNIQVQMIHSQYGVTELHSEWWVWMHPHRSDKTMVVFKISSCLHPLRATFMHQ
jgi:hypothetical protein